MEEKETKTIEQEVMETKTEVKTTDKPCVSDYARFFNSASIHWTKSSEHNLMFLRLIQRHCNDLLKARRHLFLNEVYDQLDIPRTKAGQVVGWIYDEKNPMGDNFVDFGIYNLRNENFVNGYESSILLDFNVDGNILERLEEG